MLNILRKRSQSIVIQIVVLAIAIVFVFWGVGTNLGNKRNSMAKVNGEEIPIAEYQRAYDNTVDNYRTQFGGTIPPGFLDALGLQQQVINQLIQTAVFRQGGREMGVTVSKVATQDEIKTMEVFQTNGQFDLNLYKNVLSQNRMTPTSFEAGLRNDLLTRKVADAVEGFALLPDGEVQSRFDFDNEEIRLAYLKIKSDDFLDKVEMQDDELAKWYEDNKNKYLSDPQIRIKYLIFDFEEDLKQIEISEDAIRARYEQNMDQYVVPEQRHARHILLQVKESDDEEVRANQKKKAEEVLLLVQQGQDFADLAKEYSEGPSGPSGGDLGFFGRGAMVPAFDEAVFKLNSGEISGVVETNFGYHIIKVEEVREPSTRTFAEVKEEIADNMRQQEVKGYTFKRASQAYEDIILSGSLQKFSEAGKGNVQQTDYFSRSAPPEDRLSDPKLLQTAFSLKKGELSSLVETGQGYSILFVDDIKQPEVPAMEAVRDRVVDEYKKSKSVELARENAEELLQNAQDTMSLVQTVGSSAGLQESGYIQRSNMSGEEDLPAAVAQKAFDLSLKEPLPQEPFVENGTYIVYELLERKAGEKKLDAEQRQQLEGQLLTSNQNTLLQAWLSYMQANADIWVNDQLLQ